MHQQTTQQSLARRWWALHTESTVTTTASYTTVHLVSRYLRPHFSQTLTCSHITTTQCRLLLSPTQLTVSTKHEHNITHKARNSTANSDRLPSRSDDSKHECESVILCIALLAFRYCVRINQPCFLLLRALRCNQPYFLTVRILRCNQPYFLLSSMRTDPQRKINQPSYNVSTHPGMPYPCAPSPASSLFVPAVFGSAPLSPFLLTLISSPHSALLLPASPLQLIRVDSAAVLVPTLPRTPPLLPSVSRSPTPNRAAKRPATALVDDDGMWHCSLGCGTLYEKSSGRSIRRHMTLCFRSHWPGGKTLSESEVQVLMSAQQESGQLVTGLRRWRKRQSCRPTVDLSDDETWTCPNGCSKVYRVTSSRSIRLHLLACEAHASSSTKDRAASATESPTDGHAPSASTPSTGAVKPHVGAIGLRIVSPVSTPTTPSSLPELDEKSNTASTPSSMGITILGQYDGMSDRASVWEESVRSNHDTQIRYHNNRQDLGFAPRTMSAQCPLFAYSWEDTPLRVLLRRHQVEVQQLNARHITETISVYERSLGG